MHKFEKIIKDYEVSVDTIPHLAAPQDVEEVRRKPAQDPPLCLRAQNNNGDHSPLSDSNCNRCHNDVSICF